MDSLKTVYPLKLHFAGGGGLSILMGVLILTLQWFRTLYFISTFVHAYFTNSCVFLRFKYKFSKLPPVSYLKFLPY